LSATCLAKELNLKRLTAKGYGKSSTKVVDACYSCTISIPEGWYANFTEQFVNSLPNDEQKEIAHQINRRTEFKVMRTDYEPPKK